HRGFSPVLQGVATDEPFQRLPTCEDKSLKKFSQTAQIFRATAHPGSTWAEATLSPRRTRGEGRVSNCPTPELFSASTLWPIPHQSQVKIFQRFLVPCDFIYGNALLHQTAYELFGADLGHQGDELSVPFLQDQILGAQLFDRL